ncbi:MAG: cation:dicarboxylase symporter family transporter [Flavobacteriia bacterium]|mgnify:CR=1 FL=1|nr:cation:dicarboxylase symporter family transporter [Flavobacteriia bacterium]OJX37675.1 MAG: dicarboxylate/amino acid:cation symporter [Flavobacteriia bacterium 40-80]
MNKWLNSIYSYFALYLLVLVLLFTAANTGHFDLNSVIRLFGITILYYISYKRKKLSLWIFTSMLFGIEVGITFPLFGLEMERLGTIFLRLIKSLVAPLILSTLVVGIAGHSNIKQLGRIGLKSIIYFEVVTTFALLIGLLAINLTKAGEGVNVEVREADRAKSEMLLKQTEVGHERDHIVEIFPENIAKAITNNEILQVVVFSVIFAIGLGMVQKEEPKRLMIGFFEGLSEIMFKFTDIVMYFAPVAVFGALAATIAKSGLDILYNLLQLVLTLYGALVAFVVLVLIPIALISKIKLKDFWKAIQEPVSLAFATASSEAALPKAMENLEKFGVSKKVVGFVLPTGYSFNLDGTTLYLSLATVFIAQMCGVDMSIGEQIGICLMLMLTSKGVAGVRGASFVILAGAAATIKGVTIDKVSIILAVDALMDMARTSINVIGNCLATVVIAKSEKEFHPVEGGIE